MPKSDITVHTYDGWRLVGRLMVVNVVLSMVVGF